MIGGNPHVPRSDFRELGNLTLRTPPTEVRRFIDAHPELLEDVARVRERLLELELARGEAPTPATHAVLALQSVHGIDTLVRVLTAIGQQDFKQLPRWSWRQTTTRITTLTYLVSICYPSPEDTPESFAARVIPALPNGKVEERLLQLVFLAPQWTRFIEPTLKWPGLMEGVYWYLAHMSDGEAAGGRAASDEDSADGNEGSAGDGDSAQADATADGDGEQQPNAWERLIRERTPLTKAERAEGAIDVAWFTTVVAALGVKRWQALSASAKFAATAAQAKKAQLLGDILLGKAGRKQLVTEIKTKRLKQTVQWFGLLPLAAVAKREAELLDRYKVLQEYHRYAKTLSGLTKPSALRAVEIGMQNLARTAGYADPLRLEWSMEAKATADLAAGPVSAKKGDVTVTLSLDEQSQPVVAVARGDKPLKSVPTDIKQDKQIAALLERVTDVKRQASRVKQSLEGAMVRGDSFTGDELRRLAEHAILWPQLNRLILIGEGIAGYPDKGGQALRDAKGKLEPVKPGEVLRIAHAYDLFASKNWQDWQRECFAVERRQPFKQVFRELYVLTKQEQQDGKLSHRYAGQQINPTQATALWGSRGWSTQEGIGKTYHAEGITVDIGFQSGGWSPLEVEGWTLDHVSFHTRDDWKPMPLKDVPPRVFSEAMRDLDLVVSVAHRGGVDPEASASTVEMRSRLVEETARLLGLKNLKLKPSHVVIDGHLAQYSIHLGSGVVHRLPGGAVCIVPVHAQHRGRLFLPFADDDPKTAEVVSKVLLLARDSEIQDPTVLEQLRG